MIGGAKLAVLPLSVVAFGLVSACGAVFAETTIIRREMLCTPESGYDRHNSSSPRCTVYCPIGYVGPSGWYVMSNRRTKEKWGEAELPDSGMSPISHPHKFVRWQVQKILAADDANETDTKVGVLCVPSDP